jgi:hypothetical protein
MNKDELRAMAEERRRLAVELMAKFRGAEPRELTPADTVERWKDGTPKDRLAALEEKLDLDRAKIDPRYYEANRAEIQEAFNLAQQRQKEQADAERQAALMARHQRVVEHEAKARAEAAAAAQAAQEARDAEQLEIMERAQSGL